MRKNDAGRPKAAKRALRRRTRTALQICHAMLRLQSMCEVQQDGYKHDERNKIYVLFKSLNISEITIKIIPFLKLFFS